MIPGIHVSTSGGIQKAPGRLQELGLNAGQIFTANQRRWESPAIPPELIELFRTGSESMELISHASYLINPASSREDVRLKSETALICEIERCRLLGIPCLVLHPGAHQNAGLEVGMAMVASALARAVENSPDGPMILLENTAGAGTTIGCRFEELARIRELSGAAERIGFCIDTAHAHGAGYRMEDPGFPEELCEVLGKENIRAFHLNGSKVELGSHRDRHEHFHTGTLQLKTLKALYNNKLFVKALGIAETPGTDEDRAGDIRMLSN